MQYTVKKPINNNILRVVDPTGCELIVTGRGLGFGVKPGYKIEAETAECSYRMTSPAVQQKLVELLERIPYEHLLLTDELVETIRQRLKYPPTSRYVDNRRNKFACDFIHIRNHQKKTL